MWPFFCGKFPHRAIIQIGQKKYGENRPYHSIPFSNRYRTIEKSQSATSGAQSHGISNKHCRMFYCRRSPYLSSSFCCLLLKVNVTNGGCAERSGWMRRERTANDAQFYSQAFLLIRFHSLLIGIVQGSHTHIQNHFDFYNRNTKHPIKSSFLFSLPPSLLLFVRYFHYQQQTLCAAVIVWRFFFSFAPVSLKSFHF